MPEWAPVPEGTPQAHEERVQAVCGMHEVTKRAVERKEKTVSNVKVVSTGYHPRQHQAVLHRSLKRFNVLVCHRRFGKTHFSLNELIHMGLKNPLKNPQYAYVAPTYGQAKRIAWDLLKDYLKDMPGVEINEADLRVDIARPSTRDKVRIILLGAENPGSIRGIYLDGVVLDEYAEMNPEIWNMVIRPALSDRLGWAIFIGTPRGTNHFYEVYNFGKNGDPEKGIKKPEDWFTATYKASETGIIPVSELEAARAVMSESEYLQEYECSFSAALVGAYYGKEMEKAEESGRIVSVPYDPALPTFTAWDLGIDDSTVVWIAQRLRNSEIRLIDYIENSGMDLDFYIKELAKRPYTYETHLLPHVDHFAAKRIRFALNARNCVSVRMHVTFLTIGHYVSRPG